MRLDLKALCVRASGTNTIRFCIFFNWKLLRQFRTLVLRYVKTWNSEIIRLWDAAQEVCAWPEVISN